MAPQDESIAQIRTESIDQTPDNDGIRASGATVDTTTYVLPEPYSADDSFRSDRLAEVASEISDVSNYISPEEFAGIDRDTAEQLQSNAYERKRWPEPMANAFDGTLRLATIRTPQRKNRIL